MKFTASFILRIFHIFKANKRMGQFPYMAGVTPDCPLMKYMQFGYWHDACKGQFSKEQEKKAFDYC